jgi:hypothetical protein
VDDEKHIPTSPVDDEKRHSTSRRPSLHHHASSPVPEVAPVLGAAGIVVEDQEKAETAAAAFKHHQAPAPTHHKHGEKGTHVVEQNGVASSPGTATETETSPEESEKEGDDEIVFPGTAQLAFLTFGLCVATFTVALGRLAVISLYSLSRAIIFGHMADRIFHIHLESFGTICWDPFRLFAIYVDEIS